MTGRRILFVCGTVVVVGAIAFGAHRGFMRDPVYEDTGETLLAQARSEAAVSADVDLPVVAYGESIRKPHARVEIGKHDLHLFGRVVSPGDLVSVAQWGRGVLEEAGISSRTLEIAVDRDARFRAVVDTIKSLQTAGYSPELFLVKDAAGELRVFHPIVAMSEQHVLIDASGAHLEASDAGSPDCHWSAGTSATDFAECVLGPQPDAGADAAKPDMRMILQMLGQTLRVEIRPTLDARYGDVIAVVDALAGVGMGFSVRITF